MATDEKSFAERVYAAVRCIPKGSVATYGQIARSIGAPRCARLVGFALHRNPYQGEVPCHRVVFADGGLAPGFAFGGPEEQRALLEGEGVVFSQKRSSHDLPCVDLSVSQW
ncbi:MAG: MGMT family protein [Bifidobacteriaceae bacterium]|nr:MGMT family protein [Bifidobacteriaceae bacterium]MCI1978188.1 MGMT family protein [Bifidobacteriaceae bacterium]